MYSLPTRAPWAGILPRLLSARHQSRVASDTWELAVMCRMIESGNNMERMPTCETLATMTAVTDPRCMMEVGL